MTYDDEIYIKETDGIKVSLCQVENDENLQEYYMCVENLSQQKLHLLGKDWNITDDKGNVFTDKSNGFKGELVELEAGEVFEMTSELPINSNMAVLYGNCKVMLGDVKKDIPIPTFMLSQYDLSKVANAS
ncbi:MAG: ApaG domain [Alphaproteobacteria bacterium]